MSFILPVIDEANKDCQDAADDSEITVLSHDNHNIYVPPNNMTQPLSDRYSSLAKEPQSTDVPISIIANGTTVSVDSVNDQRQQQQNNASIYDTFEIIDEVEWGPRKGERGYDDDQELAPKPRKLTPDPCGCQPVGLSYTDTCFFISDEGQAKACVDDSCVLFATFEECGNKCEALHTCGNNRLQRKKFCKVQTFDAGLKGKGLRLAKEGICNKGDIVGEYVGQAIKESHLSRRFRQYQRDRRLYIMALGDGVFLDARHKGGLARYINHSCEPNCRVERWKVKGIVRAAVVALRKIKPLEEFTFDYQWERQRGYAPTICHCGSYACRGTLEAPKSLEEADLQRELEGHWEQSNAINESIVNRTVQIFSSEHHEFFIGEVTNYDPSTGQHCIFYRDGKNEVWEDLNQEEWMILSEKKDNEQFMIGRKKRRPRASKPIISLSSTGQNTTAFIKNYLYVQTATKTSLWSQHLIERCERSCTVQIRAEQFAKPPLLPNPDDNEEVEKYAVLDKSPDGTVWKLTITGSDIPKAISILQRNVANIERKLNLSDETVGIVAGTSSTSPNAVTRPLHTSTVAHYTQEVIFPRKIADELKRRFNSIKEKCKNVTITFVASESVTKRFGKLVIAGLFSSDFEKASDYIWGVLQQLCADANVPTTRSSKFIDLAFEGDTLSDEDYDLLCEDDLSLNHANDSPFLKSFEEVNNCFIWIQDYEDMYPTDKKTTDSRRKIFFGCNPREISTMNTLIQTRITDIRNGVKYVNLGKDSSYMPLLTKNDYRFFQYVQQVTGAEVQIDPMTGDFIRIDGRSKVIVIDETETDRTALALDLIRLQIELYRNQNRRQSSRFFGRDWSLVDIASRTRTEKKTSDIGGLDIRYVPQHCMEISAITQKCELPPVVAAHAVLIFYRFVFGSDDTFANVKGRDVVLACVYMANKAQIVIEWKPLENIIEAGYGTFYPGSHFNTTSQEVQFQSTRVITVEQRILNALNYDIFWKGIEPTRQSLARSRKLKGKQIDSIFDFAFCSQVLSAGPELWLKFGLEYIVAVAGFVLTTDFSHILTALTVTPAKMFQAAELLMNNTKFEKIIGVSHKMFEGNREQLVHRIMSLQHFCTSFQTTQQAIDHTITTTWQTDVCGVIRHVAIDLVNRISASVDTIEAESLASIFIDCSSSVENATIKLKGSWRSVAVAIHLLCEITVEGESLPAPEDLNDDISTPIFVPKQSTGLLNSAFVETAASWTGVLQSSFTNKADIRGHLGGKNYVAAKIGEKSIYNAGLGWLFPSVHALSSSGSITDMCLTNFKFSEQLRVLASLAVNTLHATERLENFRTSSSSHDMTERFIPVSVQRWPPEKILEKEVKRLKRSKHKANDMSMEIGVSPSALREMQILCRLHGVLAPTGHPNIVLPVGIAIPLNDDNLSQAPKSTANKFGISQNDVVSSLFRTNGDQQKTERRNKKVKGSPSLVFNAGPFTLNRILSRKATRSLSEKIMLSWFDDCISMLAHCHANNLVIGPLQPDQIHIDQSGTLKLGYLYRCRSTEGELMATDRFDLQRVSRSSRKKEEPEDYANDFYVAPEILLGYPEYNKESDVWAIGSLLANLLLNRPVCSGKDRQSFLTSQYKIVGVPTRSNFPEAMKLPKYVKPLKKYVSDVKRALKKLLKDDDDMYLQHILLISQMLQLDPRKRCTAAEAIQSQLVNQNRENCKNQKYREGYAADWLDFKRRMMSIKDGDDHKYDEKKSAKRIATASNLDKDDLYDIDEMLETTTKKAKTEK